MPENEDLDPGANTQMFQAFVDRAEPEKTGLRWTRLVLAGAGLVALVILAVIVLFALAG
jgi:hypothetical protein